MQAVPEIPVWFLEFGCNSRGTGEVLYGPGRGFNPHRADEHYHVDDLPLMVSILDDTATAWCGKQ